MKQYLKLSAGVIAGLSLFGCGQQVQQNPNEATAPTPKAELGLQINKKEGVKPRNVIYILSDDHRYDFMGFTGKVSWLETPNMDKMAKGGIHFKNAFVTTSLCSPSRASILTGQFSHTHKVVDNQTAAPDDLVFFPQYLQKLGYQTSFFGKWHMGSNSHDDSPKPGFDHWESFKGQGVYYNPTLNINGKHQSYKDSTYITDLLTEHAVDWLDKRQKEKPFFIYLSHKGVHHQFKPARRHKNKYANKTPIYPPSFNMPANPDSNFYGLPQWVRAQRNSWHGVDYMYHGEQDFESFFRNYCETLLSIDESIGSVMNYLEKNGLLENTLVIYMGDNGFSFGEHGLIDKRHAYEESIKVPLLMHCPELNPGGTVVDELVQNVDLAPTILELAGATEKPEQMQGKSMVEFIKGNKPNNWRDVIYYEYFWEKAYPMTPTVFSIRTKKYKYNFYYGIWDTNELYDLEKDPYEMFNLIGEEEYHDKIVELGNKLFKWLEETNGLRIPLKNKVITSYGDWKHPNMK